MKKKKKGMSEGQREEREKQSKMKYDMSIISCDTLAELAENMANNCHLKITVCNDCCPPICCMMDGICGETSLIICH